MKRTKRWFAAVALAVGTTPGCAVETEELLDDEQTLTTEEALAAGCWNFQKGAIGNGLSYLRLADYPFAGTQTIHAVRIDNDHPRVLGYSVSAPANPFLTTAEFGHKNHDVKVAINGDFRNKQGDTWGLWKSKGKVIESDNGHPFLAYAARGSDPKHPERVVVDFFGQRKLELDDADTPGKAAISGFPELLRDGKLTAPKDCPGYADLCTGNHPRTATGVSKDGRFTYYVVVEGRLPGAAGMTVLELGKLMRDKVCAHSAINHDGGGSSTMWIKNRGVVSRCSDSTGCRHLVNHQGVRW